VRGGVLAGGVGVGVGVAAPLALGFFLTSSNDPIADILLEGYMTSIRAIMPQNGMKKPHLVRGFRSKVQ
jgi:hypothetical protein